jgi:hypothetical protein
MSHMYRSFQRKNPAPVTTPSDAESTELELGGLYTHSARPQWGLATRIAVEAERASYQFQDGKLRKITNTHAHLMAEERRPRDESERLERELVAMAGLSLARRSLREAGDELITLDQQIQLFLDDFEGGFEDATFLKKHRGAGRRRAKAHRDPAIARANELLGRKELLRLISTSRHDVVMERVIELLASTSLVNARHLETLKALDDRGVQRAASALCDLLYGDVDAATAMQAWIDAIATAGKGVHWSLATAVPALVQPKNHLCVLESVMRVQARWIAPSLRLNKTPSGKLYARIREMALRLVDELELRDMHTRDLLDVYDFVWLTLRPAARKRIAALPPAPLKSGTVLAAATDDPLAA